MPHASLTQNIEATARGLNARFSNTYDREQIAPGSELGQLMDLGSVSSDGADEAYAYYESADHPERQNTGEAIAEGGLRARSYTVVNWDWSRRIVWHRNDEMDDRIKKLRNRADDLGRNFALLPLRLFIQVITSATDSALLPSLPTWGDGTDLFNATDGDGADRFGVSGGNIESGGGVTTSALIQSDFYSVMARYHQFQDTKGQAMLPPGAAKKFIILFNPALIEVFTQAFNAQIVAQAIGDAGGGVSNVILVGGYQIQLWAEPRLTDNDWIVARADAPNKSVFWQNRMEVEFSFGDASNSDDARTFGTRYSQWENRGGVGIADPWNMVLVDNS